MRELQDIAKRLDVAVAAAALEIADVGRAGHRAEIDDVVARRADAAQGCGRAARSARGACASWASTMSRPRRTICESSSTSAPARRKTSRAAELRISSPASSRIRNAATRMRSTCSALRISSGGQRFASRGSGASEGPMLRGARADSRRREAGRGWFTAPRLASREHAAGFRFSASAHMRKLPHGCARMIRNARHHRANGPRERMREPELRSMISDEGTVAATGWLFDSTRGVRWPVFSARADPLCAARARRGGDALTAQWSSHPSSRANRR